MSGRQPDERGSGRNRAPPGRLAPAGERYRRSGRFLQRGHRIEVLPLDAGRVGADEVHDHRLADLVRRGQHLLRHFGSGRFRDQYEHRGIRIAAECRNPLQRRNATHRFVQIMAARSDSLRDARALPVDEASDLLQPCAGGADAADLAAPHHIGKGERHAVDDRRAAVRTHDQKIAVAAKLFQRDFVFERDVVAE